ncbi:MAG: hypothetical protein ACREOJ_19975, partial [Gemmatimonadaceae bacterium]
MQLVLRACGWPGGESVCTAGLPGFDWHWFLAAAARHAVVPAVHRHLASIAAGSGNSGSASGEVPSDVLNFLRARSDENALRNVMLTERLV